VSNAHERVAVGGIGTTAVIPDYYNSTTFALSGKRRCYFSDSSTVPNPGNPSAKYEVSNEFYATYVKFDTRDLKFDFPILSEGTCR